MHRKFSSIQIVLAVTLCSISMSSIVSAQSSSQVDELGMAKELGPATWARCAPYLSQPGARVYEISHPRSATMPLSPFAGPYQPRYGATAGLPGTRQVFNMDTLNQDANPGQQGTQIDAFGHFGYLDAPWDGASPLATDGAHYFGGLTQKDVKPTPESPLLKLGMEKVPPIVTTAILLDAKKHVGRGTSMKAGELVTARHIEEMLEAQGLRERGILPGDAVYVYTGWSDQWKDPDTEKIYYSMAPGLSYDAAKLLGERRAVIVGLDTPFVDPIAEGQLAGNAPPPDGTPPGLAFAQHHYLLTQMGIYLLENAKLDELARGSVYLSCTVILPNLDKGSSGSPVRPVAIGAPGR